MSVGYLGVVDLLEGEGVVPPDAHLAQSLGELEETVKRAVTMRWMKALTSERCSPRETLRTLGSEVGRWGGRLRE